MLLMLPRERPSLLILSVAGAISHNLGQLLMASLWLGTGFTLAYAPVLILSGIAMGSLTALSLRLVLPALERAGLATVSYTHLDVYKRQLIYCSYR